MKACPIVPQLRLCALFGLAMMRSAPALGQLLFEPLPSSVTVGSLPESAPFLLPPGTGQELITTRFQDGQSSPIGGVWDMIAVNLGQPEAGRFIYLAYETGSNAGVGRVDLTTELITTIVQDASFRRFDGCLWTPWNTVITGEEVTNGLVYEVTNPLADPMVVSIVDRPEVGRVAHEGFMIDADGNLYYVDEFNGGAIYRFEPANPLASDALAAGQIFALCDLSAGDGVNVGAAEWIGLNDSAGAPLEGITDPTVDGRAAADDIGASNYQRPEDLELGVLASGNQVLYVATTTTDQVFSIELLANRAAMVRVFADGQTIDAATGLAVDSGGDAFANPDNLAIDERGIVYIIEDNGPGDVWAALDGDRDGVAEFVARWASLSTDGAEPSGLYFDPFRPGVAYINVQHPSSNEDALFRLVSPVPCLGDANSDGAVNFADVTSVLQRWLRDERPFTGPGDADRNGVVDFEDVTAVLTHWLNACP